MSRKFYCLQGLYTLLKGIPHFDWCIMIFIDISAAVKVHPKYKESMYTLTS